MAIIIQFCMCPLYIDLFDMAATTARMIRVLLRCFSICFLRILYSLNVVLHDDTTDVHILHLLLIHYFQTCFEQQNILLKYLNKAMLNLCTV